MLTDCNIPQLIRLSAWNVVYSGRYSRIAEVRVQKKPTILLSPPVRWVSEPASLSWHIGEHIGLNFSGWGFYLLRSGIKQGYHNKKPCLLRDSRPNPVLVNPQSTD